MLITRAFVFSQWKHFSCIRHALRTCKCVIVNFKVCSCGSSAFRSFYVIKQAERKRRRTLVGGELTRHDFARTRAAPRGSCERNESITQNGERKRFPRASSLSYNGFKYKYEFPRENAFNYSARACTSVPSSFFPSAFSYLYLLPLRARERASERPGGRVNENVTKICIDSAAREHTARL